MFADDPVNEFFGWGKKSKKGKDKKKDKGNKKSSVEKADKKRVDQAQKIDDKMQQGQDAIDSLPEDAIDSSSFQELLESLKNLAKNVGMKLLKSIGADVLIGAVSGGVGVALKYLVKAFGGVKFVLKTMGKPLAKFAGKIKDSKAEMKEAEAGEDDPTAKDSSKKEKKDTNESLHRYTMTELFDKKELFNL